MHLGLDLVVDLGLGVGWAEGWVWAKKSKNFGPKMKILKVPKTCSNDVFEVFGDELASLQLLL